MDFEIVEMQDFTGPKAHVYSVIPEGEEIPLLDQFFEENKSHASDLKKVILRLKTMANDTGFRKIYLKEGEGGWTDGMFALKKTGRLRLYGIYFHDAVVLFGSGGYKPPEAISYQDYPPLNAKAEQTKAIAREIYRMIKEKQLKVNDDGTLE